jgi:hypothetical protein
MKAMKPMKAAMKTDSMHFFEPRDRCPFEQYRSLLLVLLLGESANRKSEWFGNARPIPHPPFRAGRFRYGLIA